MAKKKQQTKKQDTKSKKKVKKGEESNKLQRGYKFCTNCRTVLNIHKCVCCECGHIHSMKKHKIDIMKNITKGTPRILRSIIQSNQFNQIPFKNSTQHSTSNRRISEKQEHAPPLHAKKKKFQMSERGKRSIFQKSNIEQATFLKSNFPIICVTIVQDYVIYVQSINKMIHTNQSEKTTIRALKLQNLHKLGQKYTGQSQINIIHNETIAVKIKADFHIHSIKACKNCIAILTGQNSICLMVLDIKQSKQIVQLSAQKSQLKQIKLQENDQITQFCWLKSTSKDGKFKAKLVVGTLMGHLIVYQINQDFDFNVDRIIVSAHYQAITSIEECPLNGGTQFLFASGSYDGSVSIWDLNQKQSILMFQASNRKIQSLVWDVGGKYILIIRDQNLQNCYISCLYSLNSKIDNYLLLSDDIDFRLIKGENISSLICPNYISTIIPLLNPRTGNLKILQMEQLRKLSLKRKKSKKNQILYFDYKFKLQKKLIVEKTKSNEIDADNDEEVKIQKTQKTPKDDIDLIVPIYSSIALKPKNQNNAKTAIYLSTFSGYLIKLLVDEV